MVLAVLWALVGVVFARAFGFPFVDWDDSRFILSNPLVTHPLGTPAIDRLLTPQMGYIVPVTTLFGAVLYYLGGASPVPFHLACLLLHGVTVSLVFIVARRGSPNDLAAGMSAALFAFHPLVVEPVCWATGMKELLMASLALGATALFVGGVEREIGGRPSAGLLVPAQLLGIASMLAKPVSVLLGVVWLAYLWSRSRSERTGRRGWRAAVVVLLGGVGLAGFNALMRRLQIADAQGPIATGRFELLTAFGHHLHHALWPLHLHPAYAAERTAGFSDWHTVLGLAGVGAVGALLVACRRRSEVLLGLLLGVLAYLPVSQVVAFPRFVADSYLYLPLAAAAVAMAPLLGRCHLRSAGRYVLLGVGALLLLSLPCAMRQTDRWRSNENLWVPLARAEPDWEQPWQMLGQGFMFEGRAAEAAQSYEQLFARAYAPQLLVNLGQSLAAAGRLVDAECVLVEDIHRGPNRRRARHNLALLLVSEPKYQPRYQAAALESLAWARGARAGGLTWPTSLVARIEPRLTALVRQASHRERITEPWPSRACSPLRVPRRDPEWLGTR